MSTENISLLKITNKWASKATNPQQQEVYISGDCTITNYDPADCNGNKKGYVSIINQKDEIAIKYGNGDKKVTKQIADFTDKKYSLFLAVAGLTDEDGENSDKIILSINDINAIDKLNQEDYDNVWFYDVIKDLKNGVIKFVNYANETLLRFDFKTREEMNPQSVNTKQAVTNSGVTKKSTNVTKEKNTVNKRPKVNVKKKKTTQPVETKMPKDSIAFLQALGNQESGAEEKPYFCMNKYGYVGRYQMGEQAMAEMGIYKKRKNKRFNKVVYNNDWSGTFVKNKYGIKNLWDFRTSPEKQELLQMDYKKNDWKYIKSLGLDKYVGKKINGVKITESGLLAGAHLVGVGGVRKYLKSNGKNDVKDRNGTPVSTYIKKFAGYEVSKITRS